MMLIGGPQYILINKSNIWLIIFSQTESTLKDLLTDMWTKLPDDERLPYEEQEGLDKARFDCVYLLIYVICCRSFADILDDPI